MTKNVRDHSNIKGTNFGVGHGPLPPHYYFGRSMVRDVVDRKM